VPLFLPDLTWLTTSRRRRTPAGAPPAATTVNAEAGTATGSAETPGLVLQGPTDPGAVLGVAEPPTGVGVAPSVGAATATAVAANGDKRTNANPTIKPSTAMISRSK
jgi:hypothetical protein